MSEKTAYSFRKAVREDVPLILKFIRALAVYEKMEDRVVGDEKLLESELFVRQKAEVIFALEGEKEVGFALFFHNFSTFLGRSGLYLEDLFVLPEYRGKGYGKAILKSSRPSPSSAVADGWSGRVSIGTSQASTFTFRSAPRRCPTGRSTV